MPQLPPALRPGSTVGVVTVSAPEPHDFPDAFGRGVEAIRAAGYEVVVADHALDRAGYLAAEPKQLADDLHSLFADPHVDAIVCAGGGTNANRILPLLDFDLITAKPKILVGASNPTVLLNAVAKACDLVTFHGPSVVWDWGSAEPASTTLRHFQLLASGDPQARSLTNDRLRWLRQGRTSGPLVGGNLSSLQSLIGTSWEPTWDGAILVWEDVDEDIQHLDAQLTHFEQAGVFGRISGMVVGELVDCADDAREIDALVLDITGSYRFPIAAGLPFGHTPLKYTLPLGVNVLLDVDSHDIALGSCGVAR